MIEIQQADKDFQGLSLNNEYGSVHYPPGAKIAQLDDEVFEMPINFPEGPRNIFINKPALKNILIESNGAQVFRGMNERWFILTKVNNIHLPFYISSEGTDGKIEGEWFPFFGYTGYWVVKQGIREDGKMVYHPEVSRVNEILNENFRLPIHAHIRHSGRFGYNGPVNTYMEPENPIFDINEHFTYAVDVSSEERLNNTRRVNEAYASLRDAGWVNRNSPELHLLNEEARKFEHRRIHFPAQVTGYEPTHVNKEDWSPHNWISSIISFIK